MREEMKLPPAPYLPFRTFLGALDALAQGVPPKIDRTIWRTQSGLTQGLLMSAFRFFGLVDGLDQPTLFLHDLVNDPDKSAGVRRLLANAFHELLSQDLSKMTPKIMEEEMEKYGVKGATKRKAISFFLQAAKYADLPLSSFLQTQIRTQSSTPRRRRQVRVKEETPGNEQPLPAYYSRDERTGSSKAITLRSGGTVRVSVLADVFGMDSRDRDFVFKLIDMLQTYESSERAEMASQ